VSGRAATRRLTEEHHIYLKGEEAARPTRIPNGSAQSPATMPAPSGNYNFKDSSAPMKTVKEIQFGLFSPEEIKNMSVCHIEYPETMDEQRHRPREKGLNDPKLGSVDRGTKCSTCGELPEECPGHFGHIELAQPVFHVGK